MIDIEVLNWSKRGKLNFGEVKCSRNLNFAYTNVEGYEFSSFLGMAATKRTVIFQETPRF